MLRPYCLRSSLACFLFLSSCAFASIAWVDCKVIIGLGGNATPLNVALGSAESAVTPFLILPEGRFAVGTGIFENGLTEKGGSIVSGRLIIQDIATQSSVMKTAFRSGSPEGEYRHLFLSNDGKYLLASGGDYGVGVAHTMYNGREIYREPKLAWDYSSRSWNIVGRWWEENMTREHHYSPAKGLHFHPSGEKFVAHMTNHASIHRSDSGERLVAFDIQAPYPSEALEPQVVHFLGGGDHVCATSHTKLRLFNAENGKFENALSLSDVTSLDDVVASPFADYLAVPIQSAGDLNHVLYAVNSNRAVIEEAKRYSGVSGIVFSKPVYAVAKKDGVTVYSSTNHRPVSKVKVLGNVNAKGFDLSLDGKWLAVASGKKEGEGVELWSVPDQAGVRLNLEIGDGVSRTVTNLKFSSDGNWLSIKVNEVAPGSGLVTTKAYALDVNAQAGKIIVAD